MLPANDSIDLFVARLHEAQKRSATANKAFWAACRKDFGDPGSEEGILRVQNAALEQTLARHAVLDVTREFNLFLTDGRLPRLSGTLQETMTSAQFPE